MEERFIDYFGEKFKIDYSKSLDEIRNYIINCTDTLVIDTYDLILDDLIRRGKNVDYLSDKSFSFLPNGIEILIPMEDFWNDIKNYIPKSVSRLEIPSSFIEKDTKFLSGFSNLETLVISDYGELSPEGIKTIAENTSVKNIYYKGNSLGIEEYAANKGFSVLGYPYDCCLCGNTLYSNIEEFHIDNNVSDLFKPYVKIKSCDLDISSIERLYALADDNLKYMTVVETSDCRYVIKVGNKKSFCDIRVESDNAFDVAKIVNYMSNKGITIDDVLWTMKDTNYYDKDISCLEDVSKKVNIFINYGGETGASYEDFKGLLESVNWYRKIISDSNLSSIEKLMFAFDILKTFKYNESSIDKYDSRDSHRVIETGNITCSGYSNLLIQILKHLDKNIMISKFSLDCFDNNNKFLGGHSRNLIKIDDDKYNIHGIFVLDPTWDSDRSDGIDSELSSEYTSLDLYRFFLIPALDYAKIFPGDTLPDLFACYLGNDFSDCNMIDEYRNLFGKDYDGDYLVNYDFYPNDDTDNEKSKTDEALRSYLSASRPSLEQFSEMLVNVRMAEGYSREAAIKEVEKVIRINKKTIENMNAYGNNIEFFREEKGVSK